MNNLNEIKLKKNFFDCFITFGNVFRETKYLERKRIGGKRNRKWKRRERKIEMYCLHPTVFCEIFKRLVYSFPFLLCILMHGGGKKIQALKAVIK